MISKRKVYYGTGYVSLFPEEQQMLYQHKSSRGTILSMTI